MSAQPPPVPPEQQSPHGGSSGPEMDQGSKAKKKNDRERNLAEQGRQGNIQQNINNQGQQQDR